MKIIFKLTAAKTVEKKIMTSTKRPRKIALTAAKKGMKSTRNLKMIVLVSTAKRKVSLTIILKLNLEK